MLAHIRKGAPFAIPHVLTDLKKVYFDKECVIPTDPSIKTRFSSIHSDHVFTVQEGSRPCRGPLQVAVLFSGGPASGGHNVILGLFEALKEIDPHHHLFGYLEGFKGFLEGRRVELTKELLADYKNTGGFHLLGSSRKKMETDQDFLDAKNEVVKNRIDALVVIGGDDSNTNAARLAQYFSEGNIPCHVIGVPKTIDGDLRHRFLDISFGFDTACKIYAEAIGNIQDDARSARKYYHFIKLMGRSASLITLECALLNHPNYTFIGEEIQQKPIEACIEELAQMIITRIDQGKEYGVVLIPEGLLEFVPAFTHLIHEINQKKIQDPQQADHELSHEQKSFYQKLPRQVQAAIFLDRDPHGNIPLSQIATERVVIEWVQSRLEAHGASYLSRFRPVEHFFGYEGRSASPTLFDAVYTHALGRLAGLATAQGLNGMMVTLSQLHLPIENWQAHAIPLTSLMKMMTVKGKLLPVIEKTLVDIQSPPFLLFASHRKRWMLDDDYRSPGPIQFFGPHEVTWRVPEILINK